MTIKRWATKRDAAESEIVQALQKVGARVWRLDYPVDLLVLFRDNWYLLEVKTPIGNGHVKRYEGRQEAQNEFLMTTSTPVVKTPTEALNAIGAI